VRRSSPLRGVTEQGRMLQAKAAAELYAALDARPGAALEWQQAGGGGGAGGAVNAQRWPRSCASSCARQSGANTMHAPIGVVLPGQEAGRAAPSHSGSKRLKPAKK
jgi:hypothetical protein